MVGEIVLIISMLLKIRNCPLAVHYDNGWGTNINRKYDQLCNKLGVDLITVIEDWKTFKNIQNLSFSSVPDIDILLILEY